MGHHVMAWAAFGIGATLETGTSQGSDKLREILDADDIDEAFEDWLTAAGLDLLEGELGGDLVTGDNELWSVVAKSTVGSAGNGGYEILSEPTESEREQLRIAGELLGGAWVPTWRIQADFG